MKKRFIIYLIVFGIGIAIGRYSIRFSERKRYCEKIIKGADISDIQKEIRAYITVYDRECEIIENEGKVK
jgi:hypothetical protein